MPNASVLPEPVGRAAGDVAPGEGVGDHGGLDGERFGDPGGGEARGQIVGHAERAECRGHLGGLPVGWSAEATGTRNVCAAAIRVTAGSDHPTGGGGVSACPAVGLLDMEPEHRRPVGWLLVAAVAALLGAAQVVLIVAWLMMAPDRIGRVLLALPWLRALLPRRPRGAPRGAPRATRHGRRGMGRVGRSRRAVPQAPLTIVTVPTAGGPGTVATATRSSHERPRSARPRRARAGRAGAYADGLMSAARDVDPRSSARVHVALTHRLTLVVAAPGWGKTTLLRTLASAAPAVEVARPPAGWTPFSLARQLVDQLVPAGARRRAAAAAAGPRLRRPPRAVAAHWRPPSAGRPPAPSTTTRSSSSTTPTSRRPTRCGTSSRRS